MFEKRRKIMNATTAPLKARLLEEAKKHERLSDEAKRDEC
jgi:hypothetical protein